MSITSCISNSYPTAHQYSGVNSIENILFEKKYLVVIDDNKEYKGILTPCDLIKRPRKIIIDCISDKEQVCADETILTTLDKFNKTHLSALPVFKEDKFIGVVERYDLITRVKQKIDELYNKSLISEKVKLSFLDNISHEVRTPLNGLLGFLDIISKLNVDDFKTKGEIPCTIIRKCTDKFLLTMNDLIDLALIHAGEDIEIEYSKIEPEQIFSDLKEYFITEALLLDTEVSVNYSNSCNSSTIISDEKKLKHILYHLIDNGIKFSDTNEVNYSCSIENSIITFYVSSKGPKINKELKNKIFNYFEKPDILNNGFVNGLGIGLPLVKKLTASLGGTVDFVTTEELTTFYCSFPLKPNENITVKNRQAFYKLNK